MQLGAYMKQVGCWEQPFMHPDDYRQNSKHIKNMFKTVDTELLMKIQKVQPQHKTYTKLIRSCKKKKHEND